MEERLFYIACIMYVFSLATRWLIKKNKLAHPRAFAWWRFLYLMFFLNSAWYLYLFVSGGGVDIPFGKAATGVALIWGYAVFQFFRAKQSDAAQKEKHFKNALEWCNTVYFAGFVASFVMFFFLQAFKIPSASMRNTLMEGDHLFVNKAIYGMRIPFTQYRFWPWDKIRRGDVVIFRFPANSREQQNCGGSQYGRDFVKRVIGLPGDIVQIEDSHVYLNGRLLPARPYEKFDAIKRYHYNETLPQEVYQQLWENHRLDSVYSLELRDQFGPVKVPENSYFMLGDNRDNSCDSRFWGPVPRENIKGKAWLLHWPLSRFQIME